MIVLRFRSKDDHEELLMKVKRMKKFTQDIEDCLEEAIDDAEYRRSYRKDDDDDDWDKPESRYSRMSKRGRM